MTENRSISPEEIAIKKNSQGPIGRLYLAGVNLSS